MNRGKQSNNTSGFKGVSWHNQAKKWMAQLVSKGKRYSLGLYDSKEEAAGAYQKAAEKHHGEFFKI